MRSSPSLVIPMQHMEPTASTTSGLLAQPRLMLDPAVDRSISHKARFRASLAWAAQEYASTLSKLAR